MSKNKNLMRKAIAAMLIIFIVLGECPYFTVNAQNITPSVPQIKVKYMKDSLSVKITINKTKNADGYEIYYSGHSDLYDGYRAEYDEVLSSSLAIDGFGLIATVKKSGSKKRSISVKPMVSGKLQFKVRAYTRQKDGSLIYSDFSKAKTVNVKEIKVGYSDTYDFSKLKKGDVFKFGAYEQDNDFTNGREPIEWIVLAKDDSELFVLSKYALDCIPFNNIPEYVTWAECDLRYWLNDKFYNAAFNDYEKKMIESQIVKTDDTVDFLSPEIQLYGGVDTSDKVFVLSTEEFEGSKFDLFADNDDEYGPKDNAICLATEYVKAQGGAISTYVKRVNGDIDLISDMSCDWWLRSQGKLGLTRNGSVARGTITNWDVDTFEYGRSLVSSVSPNGYCNLFSDITKPIHISEKDYGYTVRPALVINLEDDHLDENDATLEKFRNLRESDEIIFGSYEQDNNLENGKEDIEWVVLSTGTEVVLLSKYALDCLPIDDETKYSGWEKCSLRKWLNNEFYNIAFSKDEKSVIKLQTVNNSETEDGYVPENDTLDRVFILSDIESSEYNCFRTITDNKQGDCNDVKRRCAPTLYAISQGVKTYSDYLTDEGLTSCGWWVRSSALNEEPGEPWSFPALFVNSSGIGFEGRSARMEGIGVRPVIVIDLTGGRSFNPDSIIYDGLTIDATNFPDLSFRKYIYNKLDKDDNGRLSKSERSITKININDSQIRNLKGIEFFPKLKELECSNNELMMLDVSKNIALKELDCSFNKLISLDMSNNTLLTSLECNDNQLTSLDVSKNTKLEILNCGWNRLTSLDVSKNTALMMLSCTVNRLTNLDLRKCNPDIYVSADSEVNIIQ